MNLKEYLFYSEMSVTDFSKLADLDRTFVSSIISGGRRPSAKSIRAIERATKGKVKASTITAPIKKPEDWEEIGSI
jgi:DNA-binding transcriptional regulator YdaS (Cro superfamily)